MLNNPIGQRLLPPPPSADSSVPLASRLGVFRLWVSFVLGFSVLWAARVAAVPSPPPTVDLVLKEARSAAARDDHRQAIVLYLQVLEIDSSLEEEIATEIGHQYTWADMPDSAIRWYRLRLHSHPEDREAGLGLARALSWADSLEKAEALYRSLAQGGDAEALVGLARVKSWRDELGRAEEIYRKVLADDPDHREARLGLAQVVNWTGWHREAERMYLDFLVSHPGDGEALVGLAAARNWMGDPDGAAAIVAPVRNSKEAREFLRQLDDSFRPAFSERASYTRDSDEIRMLRWSNRFEYSPDHHSRLALSVGISRIDQPGYARLAGFDLGLGGTYRFSPVLAVTLSPLYQEYRYGLYRPPTGSARFRALLGDGYATFTPGDRFRFDVGCSREVFAIPLTILRGITATSISLGVDARITRSLLLISSARQTFLSDSNRKFSAAQRLRWRPDPWRGFRLSSAAGYGYFNYERTLDNGYYNPSSYLSLFQSTSFRRAITRQLALLGRLRLAIDREEGERWLAVAAFGGSLVLKTASGYELEAGYENSRSRLASPTGYRYQGMYIQVAGPLGRRKR